jgi:two-component system response regulator DevR
MKQPIRVLLVDDHEVVRVGLRTLLDSRPDLSVVDDAGSGREAVDKAIHHKPDVVIMDLRLPEEDGVEAIRRIREKCPDTRVLVLTAFCDDQLLFDAIVAGANGYMLKEINSEKLVEGVRALARGESLLDPRVTERILEKFKEGPLRRDSAPFSSLSFQEKRILALIADGITNREIGERLRLSEKTIRNYVSQILSKLGLHSRTQAAAYAIRHHLEIRITPAATK